MTRALSFDDVFAVMSAASVGDASARVAVPGHPDTDDPATRLALALNVLLDDHAASAGALERELAERARLAARVQRLADASREFSAATGDVAALLDVVARRIGELVGDLCVVTPLSADGLWLEFVGAAYHAGATELAAARALFRGRRPLGDGVLRRVVETREPILLRSVDAAAVAAETDLAYEPFFRGLDLRSTMTVPLVCRGAVVAIAHLVRSRPGEPYSRDDLVFVQSFADHAALAIDNARSYAAERSARAAAEEAEAHTRASELRCRLMFDAGPLSKWVSEAATSRIVDANDAAVREYGYTREELRAMTLADLRAPGDPPAREGRGGAPSPTARTGVVSLRKKGGEVVQVELTEHVFELEGRPCRITVGMDLTDRLGLEGQLRHAQKMEAVGRLAGGVAHDFNNLLSVVLSYGDMLLADLRPGEPMRASVEEIHKAGKRATELTRQLLMFSRQQVIAPKVLDLDEILAGMDKMLQRIVGADVELVAVPAGSLGRVRVDPSSIEQVILNLAVNARDAMPTGGKLTMQTVDVVLDEAYAKSHLGVRPGPHVMLAVTDTGTGIDPAVLPRIFEPFFTTKESGKGTGLGLSTVFGVVQRSGGSVWVYSEVGRGTTFKIYLPRVDAEVDPEPPVAAQRRARGSETILLVEDDDQVRVVARDILQRQGYRVLEARHAGEALLRGEEHPGTIHLLLSDVVMPNMSGPALAERLGGARPGMKVLCMSGYTDDSIVRHGVLDAHIAFLQKPITPDSLAKRVREVLDGVE